MSTTGANIVRIYDVLLGTFPDNPTDQAIDELQGEILSALETAQPRGVILDISGVRTMDSFFARNISETAQMVDLMGGSTIVVGMRPAVAITAAELGYYLDEVEKARSTDHALEMLGVSRTPR